MNIDALLKDFRLCYDKFIVHACVVPLSNVNELMKNTSLLEPGDYVLSGTKVVLTGMCNMRISGRYLISMHDGIYGVYIVAPSNNCEIKLNWDLHGINTKFKISNNEALIILIKLMNNNIRRFKGLGIPRIIKSLGFKGRVLIYNDDLAMYVLNDAHESYDMNWRCAEELIIGNWDVMLNPCMYISSPLGFPQVSFIIKGLSGKMKIRRYYPALGKWYDVYNLVSKNGEMYLLSINLQY